MYFGTRQGYKRLLLPKCYHYWFDLPNNVYSATETNEHIQNRTETSAPTAQRAVNLNQLPLFYMPNTTDFMYLDSISVTISHLSKGFDGESPLMMCLHLSVY